MHLELFRINILTICQNNDVFAAAGDRKKPILIDKAEVAGAQPPLAYYFRCLSWCAVIALHQDRPADTNFAYAVAIHRIHSNRDSGRRFSNRADVIAAERSDGRCSRCFCQTVRLQDGVTKLLELFSDAWLEPGTTACKQPQ